MKRSVVIVGGKAKASADFSLVDLAGTSGRLDVLLRSLRSALLVSHGLRREAVVYLVLLGGELAPRVLRVDGATVKFLRPDERALATLAQKALAEAPLPGDAAPDRFVEVRPGVSVAAGGIAAVFADLGREGPFASVILEEDAPDVREIALDAGHVAVFVGDHHGFDDATREALASLDAARASVGPVSVHADDAVAIVSNELDRREASAGPGPGPGSKTSAAAPAPRGPK